MTTHEKKNRKRPIVSGIILIGLGLLMLLAMHNVLSMEQGWPLIIIVVGLAIVAAAFTRDKKASPPDTPPSRQM
ncbi:MAG: DUF5668 domain-containing protein [candidate division Zixibacteria bacterium]|nr:DUF5668 domain-containing protein [candidate division Zixibacteria bacterium]